MAISVDAESHEELKRQLAQAEADGQRMAEQMNLRRDALGRALALAEAQARQIGRLTAALQTIADNCDPDDPPWTIPENGRQFVGRTALAALDSYKSDQSQSLEQDSRRSTEDQAS